MKKDGLLLEPLLKITKKEMLQRRMMECVLGAFEIGYELGKLDQQDEEESEKS